MPAISPVKNDQSVVLGSLERFRPEAHAAARWARSLVRLIDSPKDPRTVSRWGRWVGVSPRALRTWCLGAGIAPRSSLVFGRLLRAVFLSDSGRHRLENLLDVVDRRTFTGLLRLAGFAGPDDLPMDVDEFLARQHIVADPAMLYEVRRALETRATAPETIAMR